ncbi:MAG: DUF2157 domain-containing protein [Candidatus Eremiobacteraeota bacterium]|nr:DUF2157 domain-containing protein [Candidatus Eremiobacteraeota bacterium]
MSNEVPIGFRRVLARELPAWQADGVIGESAAQTLTARYALDRVGEPQRGWVTTAFAILGAVAIGAGIISFVAANWAALGSGGRFAIVFGATIAAYGAGLALRARDRGALAEAAFVCGALGFGGSLALGMQQYNVAVSDWVIYAVCAAGLVPLAFALRSVPVATVALAAAALSLPLRLFDTGRSFDQNSGQFSVLLLAQLAVIALGAALLTVRLRVLWFRELALAVVALGLLPAVFQWPFLSRTFVVGIMAALLLAAGISRSKTLRGAAIVAALLVAAPSTFWGPYAPYDTDLARGGAYEPLAFLLLALAAAASFLVHGRKIVPFVPAGIAVALAIVLPHVGPLPPVAAVLLANALVLVPAALLIARGINVRDRAAFLCGTAVCAVDGFLRFAEYDQNLTAKALAFVVVGIAFIAAALLFERDARPVRARAA